MHRRPTAPQILFKFCIEQFHVTSFSVHVRFAAAMWCTTVVNGRKHFYRRYAGSYHAFTDRQLYALYNTQTVDG